VDDVIGDEVADVLLQMRAQAESLMRDTVRIVRPGQPVTDPDTGQVTVPTTVLYEGCGKVQTTAAQGVAAADVGGEFPTVTRLTIHVPVGVADCLPGDVAEVVASVGGMAGRKFRILERMPQKTWSTAFRFPVEEVT